MITAATILTATYQLLSYASSTQSAYLSMVYASYYGSNDPSKSITSQYMSGARLMPKSILRHYYDPVTPSCPHSLYLDILHYLVTVCHTSSQWRPIYYRLISIARQLPAADHPNLIPCIIPSHPSIGDTAVLWTTILWYCMVWDHVCASMDPAA